MLDIDGNEIDPRTKRVIRSVNEPEKPIEPPQEPEQA